MVVAAWGGARWIVWGLEAPLEEDGTRRRCSTFDCGARARATGRFNRAVGLTTHGDGGVVCGR